MDPFEPRRVSDKELAIDITDNLIPWGENDQPVYVNVGGKDLFVPIFSTVEKLCETMEQFNVEYESIKRIDDPNGFMNSFPHSFGEAQIRFLLDPWLTDTGTVRFKEIMRTVVN